MHPTPLQLQRARRIVRGAATLVLGTLVFPALASASLTYSNPSRIDYATGSGPEQVVAIDLNNDGHPDLVTADYSSGGITVRLSNGAGGFLAATFIATGSGSYQATPGDFNSDGNIDLAVANFNAGTVSVLLGNGNGTFQPPVTAITGSGPAAVCVGDFDGNGTTDIAAALYGENAVAVVHGNGIGGWGTVTRYATGAGPRSVVTADMSGDGYPDVVVACQNADCVSLLINDRAGSFAPHLDYQCGHSPRTVAVGYLDTDDNLDVVSTDYSDNTVSVFMGNGKGQLGKRTAYATGTGPLTVAIADLNFDGNADVVTADDAANTVSVMMNDGTGALTAHSDRATGLQPYGVTVGDVDGDGEPDIITANFTGNSNSVLKGDVPGGFGIGQTVVDLAAPDQNGVVRHLSDYSTKWVIVDMSSVWCAPCITISNQAQAVYNTLTAAGIPFEYVTGLVDGPTLGRGASLYQSQVWAHNRALLRPILHSNGHPWSSTRSYFAAMPVQAYPQMMLLGPGGVVKAYESTGSMTGQQTVDWVRNAIGGVPPLTLGAGSPAPPAPPAPPSTLKNWWFAQTGSNVELDYGATGWVTPTTLDNVDYSFMGPQPPMASYEYAAFPPIPGFYGNGLVTVYSETDSLTGLETFQIVVGSYDPTIPLMEGAPWTVKLKGLAWADGLPRTLAGGAPQLWGYDWDPGSSQTFATLTNLSPPVSLSGNDLIIGPFTLWGLYGITTTTWGFSVEGLQLRHASSSIGPSGVPAPPVGDALAFAAPRPNPASRVTALEWSLPAEQHTSLVVLDLAGRPVRTLMDGRSPAGRHTASWDLSADDGRRVPTGVYFVRLRAGGLERTQRMVVLD